MAIYLKKFENHTQYETYINGSGAVLPNVSICTIEGDVHYNPYVEPVETRVVAKFNVTDTTNPTKIASGVSIFNAMQIDGVEQSSLVTAYTFNTLGEHTVKYTLVDPTSIGYGAFYGCRSLTDIYIPDSVTSISDGAFTICYSLTNIDIPNSVTSIGESAFSNCSGLTSIEIPSGVTSIGDYAFAYCTSITSIDIPSGVTSIGKSAFAYCTSITSIDIPSGVTSIGISAFDGCSSLTSITVDNNNNVYDSRNNCNAIIETSTNKLIHGCNTTIIPNTVTSIGDGAFAFYSNITNIEIPSGVTSIGHDAFYYCYGITNIIIPSGVTSIADGTFRECIGLTSINISDNVTSIDNNAFYDCISLSSCTIGSGVTSIGKNAFYYCKGLTNIISNAAAAPTIQSNTFRNIKTNGTLYVPQGSNGYDVWMGTRDYYLGKYNWTKVEQ